MGKSNAKVYVKSSEGIRFSDIAGEDEAKENWLMLSMKPLCVLCVTNGNM
ncbi:MAG: hypothetical protein PHI24_11820 [Desulfitobacteriaceae bacterium]|nr:hypothetical protein [Desulfitobacteriaceae bacterium]